MSGSIRAICARTGLSTSTVSLALRGEYGVAEPTRRRVLQAAQAIGYDLRRIRAGRDTPPVAANGRRASGAGGPNGHAAPPRRRGARGAPPSAEAVPAGLSVAIGGPAIRRQVAVVYPAESGLEAVARAAHYGRYLRGIQAAALQLAVDLVFLPARGGEMDPLLAFMLGGGPDAPHGVVLLGMGDEAPVVQRAFEGLRRGAARRARPGPVVLLSRYVPELPCSWVSVDHVRAAELMTDHLVEQGYRTIAHVGVDLVWASWQRQRRRGYLNAVRRHGLAADPAGELVEGATPEALHRLERLIRRSAVPVAIFVPNDNVALHLRDELAGHGLEAPRDYGLAGYDNIADDILGRPSGLSSIGFPRERMGALALRLARELCDDPTQEQQHVVVAPELHARESTALGPARAGKSG